MAVFRPLPELNAKDVARFWSKVDRKGSDECWPWLGGRDVDGYGIFKARGRMLRASRVTYFLVYGVDPLEAVVCHGCDNPPCCNGAHLRADTYQGNTLESVAKGRANSASGERHGSRTKPESRARGERVAGAVFTAEQVLDLRRRYTEGTITMGSLASEFGVDRKAISHIVNGRNWKHLPFDAGAVRRIAFGHQGRRGERHASARLTEADVRSIRDRHREGKNSPQQLADEYGVTKGTIYHLLRRLTWTHVP